MNQFLNEVLAASESLLDAPNNTLKATTPQANSANRFPYAEAILASIHRAELLDNLAPELPSDAQIGQFTRWLRQRGTRSLES
ncbi:hypothetical protein [Hymenobacter crusticola]|uniref:Uncharacterized protein n=1 Tax=Hymenobacter crusticola TaxID=1770526 RepID=A0A243W9R6_9BACT|nr:hypothetical protein [Hymenobacter crusticola]OUJ72288.1 hypothetical protein BXP70_18690 [Hymenobacter crusticola]